MFVRQIKLRIFSYFDTSRRKFEVEFSFVQRKIVVNAELLPPFNFLHSHQLNTLHFIIVHTLILSVALLCDNDIILIIFFQNVILY